MNDHEPRRDFACGAQRTPDGVSEESASQSLAAERIVPCAEVLCARGGGWLTTTGIVLVRQRPGSGSGVLFITIEDETGIANLVIWPIVFEKQRRLILSARMIAIKGRVQREGEVIHFVTQEFSDLSSLPRSVGNREHPSSLPCGPGNGARHESSRKENWAPVFMA